MLSRSVLVTSEIESRGERAAAANSDPCAGSSDPCAGSRLASGNGPTPVNSTPPPPSPPPPKAVSSRGEEEEEQEGGGGCVVKVS